MFLVSSCSDTEKGIDTLISEIPNPRITNNSWIQDSANILQNASEIDIIINNFEAKTGVEIAIVTLPSIQSYVPKDFVVALFNHWGIGKKGKDNGILILHVMDQRRVEIEIGYGLEGDLPDVVVKRIIDTYTIPSFKEDNFSKGHLETVLAIIAKLENPSKDISELVNAPSDEQNQSEAQNPEIFKRTDEYDFQGKSYSQLTDEEVKIFSKIIDTYNITPNYFLTDDENKLLTERNEEIERKLKEKSQQIKINLIIGYITFLIGLFVLQKFLGWIIPSPTFKYHWLRITDFPLYYSTVFFPIFLIVLLINHLFDDDAIPGSIFIIFASYILHTIFFGGKRVERLIQQLTLIRKIPRKCNECNSVMIRLNEENDDKHLSKGQIAEEIVKSKDYDVWVCENCNANQIIPFKNLDPTYISKGVSFKKVVHCPECKFETFVCKSSKILSAATYSSAGQVKVDRVCEHCKHKETETLKIPKKQRSSSGSGSSSGGGGGGGSFGGGSSGGGGSGGSY